MEEKNIVSKDFRDKLTKDFHPVGSEYVSDDTERVEELKELGYLNVKEDDFEGSSDNQWPKHLGGGNYELSNGEKVKKKADALKAQEELDQADNTE